MCCFMISFKYYVLNIMCLYFLFIFIVIFNIQIFCGLLADSTHVPVSPSAPAARPPPLPGGRKSSPPRRTSGSSP